MDFWMVGPSAIGSVKGRPSSITSTNSRQVRHQTCTAAILGTNLHRQPPYQAECQVFPAQLGSQPLHKSQALAKSKERQRAKTVWWGGTGLYLPLRLAASECLFQAFHILGQSAASVIRNGVAGCVFLMWKGKSSNGGEAMPMKNCEYV